MWCAKCGLCGAGSLVIRRGNCVWNSTKPFPTLISEEESSWWMGTMWENSNLKRSEKCVQWECKYVEQLIRVHKSLAWWVEWGEGECSVQHRNLRGQEQCEFSCDISVMQFWLVMKTNVWWSEYKRGVTWMEVNDVKRIVRLNRGRNCGRNH